jgi:hypothetical protein
LNPDRERETTISKRGLKKLPFLYIIPIRKMKYILWKVIFVFRKKVLLSAVAIFSSLTFLTGAGVEAVKAADAKVTVAACITKTFKLYKDDWDYVPNYLPYAGETLELQYFYDRGTYWEATYSNC